MKIEEKQPGSLEGTLKKGNSLLGGMVAAAELWIKDISSEVLRVVNEKGLYGFVGEARVELVRISPDYMPDYGVLIHLFGRNGEELATYVTSSRTGDFLESYSPNWEDDRDILTSGEDIQKRFPSLTDEECRFCGEVFDSIARKIENESSAMVLFELGS